MSLSHLPIPISILAPTAAASLAYLNARLSLFYDSNLIKNFITSITSVHYTNFRDRLNLFYVFEKHALHSRTSTRTFIIHNGESWTYKGSYENVLRYAGWLKGLGVQAGDIVAMDFKNNEVFVWVWFALWSLGARPAFLNYNLTGKPLLHCIKTSTAKLLLVDKKVKDRYAQDVLQELGSDAFRTPEEKDNGDRNTEAKGGKVEVVMLNEELEQQILSGERFRAEDEARAGQSPPNMCILIYTSGTTGLPKPAVVSWWKANLGSAFVSRYLPLKKDDILYTCMPLYHSSAALLALLTTLQAGCTIALGAHFSVQNFWPDVRAARATVIQYVGETCRYLLSAPPSSLDTQHRVRLAYGNGLRPDVWDKFKERFGIHEIAEFYGATEGPGMMWNRSRNHFSAGAVGRNGVIAQLILGGGMAVAMVDYNTDQLQRDPKTGLCIIASRNEPGELLYQLDPADVENKFQGYYGNQKATSKKVVRDVKKKGDAWYSTGDVMKYDDEGRWWFVDRIGDTFRWKSENVSTAEVAGIVGRCPSVREANVYGVQVPGHDGRSGCAAIIFEGIEAKYDGELVQRPDPRTLKNLAEHNLENLPKYAVPLFLRVTSGLQTTGTNKQQKHHLREDGIVPEKAEAAGDRMYWLRNGTYEDFGRSEYEDIVAGKVKL